MWSKKHKFHFFLSIQCPHFFSRIYPLFNFTRWFFLSSVWYFCFLIHLLIKKILKLETSILTFKIMVLLRYSQNVQFNCLKCTNQWFSVCSHNCATITTEFWTILAVPWGDALPINSHPSFLPNTPHPLATFIYFLSIELPTLDISYRWNCILCLFLWQTAFTFNMISGWIYTKHESILHSCLWQYNSPSYP